MFSRNRGGFEEDDRYSWSHGIISGARDRKVTYPGGADRGHSDRVVCARLLHCELAVSPFLYSVR